MNIIICGAGRVGFTIAKQLSDQGHSITVIDQSSEDIQKIDEALDVKAIVGKATYPSILEKANTSKAKFALLLNDNHTNQDEKVILSTLTIKKISNEIFQNFICHLFMKNANISILNNI